MMSLGTQSRTGSKSAAQARKYTPLLPRIAMQYILSARWSMRGHPFEIVELYVRGPHYYSHSLATLHCLFAKKFAVKREV